MNNIYLIATTLWCSTIAVAGCAPSSDPGGASPAVSTAVSAISASTLTVTAGLGHTCAAGSSGIRCWGSNTTGQLGDNSTVAQRIQPVPVTGITFGTTMVAAGGQHTCAIVNGAARCTGANSSGQLGNAQPGNDTTVLPDSYVPVDVTGLALGLQAIAAGDSHACAVVNGGARCWGINSFGQLGDGTQAPVHRSPVAVMNLSSGVQAIAAGGAHSCAIVNGAAMCWGLNNSGQLGNATAGNPQPGDSNLPVQVTGLTSGVQAIAAGQNHTCALANGAVKCWGANATGQLGNGVTGTNAGAPVQVTGLTSGVLAIAAGQSHSCAIVTGGAAKCWGSNSNGQLGNGSTDPNAAFPPDSNVPVQVTGLTSGVQTIATGYQHACATTSSSVLCWGFNGNAQLALDPDAASRLAAPHLVDGLVLGGCADGSDEQVFNNGMVGCAGAATFVNRGVLCAAGYQPATTLQWTSNRGSVIPTHDYWTNDLLRYTGAGSSSCFVSLSVGTDCGASTPMRVCSAAGTDPEGNHCNWTQCGLYANAPNQYFGGCAGNTTAGTLCIPVNASLNACTHFNACPKWENGFSTSASSEYTGITGASQSCTQFCAGAGDCSQVFCGGGMTQPTAACDSARATRISQLQTSVGNAVSSEASFDSPQALQQQRSNALAAISVTTSYYVSDFNFSQQCSVNGPDGFFPTGGGGGGGCQLYWDEAIVCNLNLVTPSPTSACNEACGCSQ